MNGELIRQGVTLAVVKCENLTIMCMFTELREVTEFTSGEGPGIFVRGGENFDKAPLPEA